MCKNELLQSRIRSTAPSGREPLTLREGKSSLHEKDVPRPGEDVTQGTKGGTVASRSDDGRSFIRIGAVSYTHLGRRRRLPAVSDPHDPRRRELRPGQGKGPGCFNDNHLLRLNFGKN